MLRNQEVIFVIGGPGSGKGTHCKILQENKGYHHISTGDLVRAKIEAAKLSNDQSEQAIYIREMTKQGNLLPDEFIIELIKLEMIQHPEAKGFLMDGCPRTMAQAKLFAEQIKSPDKILYFNISDELMKKRMLGRGEGREDDNPETITNRIKTYHEKTEPVINYLKTSQPHAFHEINSSGETAEVAKLIAKAMHKPMGKASLYEFAYLYWTSGNFCDAVKALEKKFSTNEFEITFPLMLASMFVLQDKDHVKTVLNANTSLAYQYHNADLAHGHNLNILALQANDPLWKNIHKGLSHATGDSAIINKLIDKHLPILFSQSRFMLDIQFERFMLAFWCEYMFGDKVNVDEFTRTRTKLLDTMRYSFYGNSLKNAPVIGGLACRFYGVSWMKSAEFKQIDAELMQFLKKADDGLMHRFKNNLIASNDFPATKIEQAVLDNTFDLVLVFDFLHNALYETLASIVRDKLDADKSRRDSYAPGLRTAFLFPFRARVANQNIKIDDTVIPKGSTIYLNILQSGLYHSWGPRACIGQGVTNWVKDRIFHHLHDIQLRVLNESIPEGRAALCHCADVPMSPERYEVTWQYPLNYLQTHLPHYNFKNVEEFYDVMKTFSNPRLTGYIVAYFIEAIKKLNIDKDQLIIVAPEVRGIPIAAIIGHELDLPVEYIRKEGKIPGPIISKKYENAYSKEILEISTDTKLKGRKAILIDDGIASGGTTKICCELVEELGGKVELILAMINHTYKEKIEAFEPYKDRVMTLFDFVDKSAKLEKSAESESSLVTLKK